MSKTRTASRRNFLVALGAGGAATVAAVAAGVAGRQAVAVKTTGAGRSPDKGYEETAHVRNYYRTARV